MKIAETVTFGGSGLNRAGEMRGDANAVARALASGDARAVPVWRGKPLFLEEGDGTRRIGWLAPDHAVFAEAHEKPVLLGIDDDGPRFARDISAWEPVEVPDTDGVFFDPTLQSHPALPGRYQFAELRGMMNDLTAREAELVATAKAVLGWHQSHGFCAKCGARTGVAMAGWQRDCAACGAHHFPRTDPVVIMLITRGNSVLMGRSPGWPEGMYSLLAGFVEPGETIEAAVRREVFEESGITVGAVSYLASQPWAFPSSLMFGCHGEATSEAITIDPVEIEDAMWVTREQMAEAFAGNNSRMRPARKGSIAHFLIWNWLADRLD